MAIGDQEWQEMNSQFEQAFKDLEGLQEQFWAGLTKEQQLDAFCCVVRRLARGELDEERSYRGVLYSVFEFGPEAYAAAQMAGYLSLHNAIYKKERLQEIFVDVLKDIDVDIDPEVLNEAMSKHGVWI